MIQRTSINHFVGLQSLNRAMCLSAMASLCAVGVLGTFSKSAQAADQFDTSGLQFDVDTIVEFEFVQSHGAYQSTFGVINLNTREKTPLIAEVKPSDYFQDVNRPSQYRSVGEPDPADFTGTPGNAVPQPLAEFEFKANTPYSFYLESTYDGRPAGIVYSTTGLNLGGNQQAKFEGTFVGLASGGTINLWDDTGSVLVKPNKEDRDFNDFIVRAGGHLACPYRNRTTGKQQLKESFSGSNAGLKCSGK
jgi:hypothetical protein